ncbi:MAG: DODA-type extradiol aromatic ring-opening family dioxygenase [Pseudomonadota bacterium]
MTRQPVLFISHGAPTFALEPGRAGALLRAAGERLPAPTAIVVVSPHWVTRDFAVTAAVRPETIHDFGGFPAPLYALRYPAPGAPALAARVAGLLQAAGVPARLDEQRGLDHGAWVPLMHLYPQAQVPVIQVSMPQSLDARAAWRLGEVLAPLREEGVLIVGSGSLTHNLYEFFATGGSDDVVPYAREFVDWARAAVQRHDRAALVDYLRAAPNAGRAHPTPEHYLPLLVAAGAAGDAMVEVLDGGMEHGMLSMESYLFG